MIPIPSAPMPFSTRGRGWKALAALLLFYAGCLYSHLAWGRAEPPIWTCESHPERHEGRLLWVIGEPITALDPESGEIEIEPDGYRVRLLARDGFPAGSRDGARLYGRVRYRQAEGFVLEPGSHTSPPLPLKNLDLYLVSLPALAFVAWAFLRRFRPSSDLTLSPRA